MTKYKDPADYIRPLYINGLSGRMLRIEAKSSAKRQILLIAGHHTSLERIFGMADYLSRYGTVTSPDLPGFGGMDAFYKIGEKPTLDNLADYLAAFIKLRYRRHNFTVFAVSVGFTITTRMLQRYPELAKRVDDIISVSGFLDKSEFRWKKRNFLILKSGSWLFSHSLSSGFIKHFILRGPVIRFLYGLAESKHPKLKDANPVERKKRLDFEVNLWKINDFRTYTAVGVWMLSVRLQDIPVSLVVHHVAVDDDHYFNNLTVEQDMRRVFKDFVLVKSQLPSHAPTVLASAKDVEPYVPPKIRALLRQKVN